jgi:hypoxanthine-DNA glycosylase
MANSDNQAPPSIGFEPISSANARILILGSLPSQRSLEAGEYYAHPRNAFWRIMAELLGASGDYEAACRALNEAGVAVWDVLQSSVRPGSLDADIKDATAMANNFPAFLERHPRISRIGFNGRKAEDLFRRLALPHIDASRIRLFSLPSTSPAHAAMSFDKKLEIWRSMLQLNNDDID